MVGSGWAPWCNDFDINDFDINFTPFLPARFRHRCYHRTAACDPQCCGCVLRAVDCGLGAGCWVLGAGCWVLGAGCRVLCVLCCVRTKMVISLLFSGADRCASGAVTELGLQALSQGPPGALLNQQYAASPSSPLVAGQITAGTRPAQMYGAAPGAAGFSLLPPQGGALLQPQQQQQQQQQLPQGMSLLPGMPGYTPAGAATATAPALAPVAAVPTLAATLPGPLPGPLNTAAAAEGPGGSLSSFADELLGVGGGGGGGGLDHQWLEDIDPSWLDPSSGFDAELEMGVPEIFNAS